MRDLPRQLTVDELAELFEGHPRLVELLAEREDPLGSAEKVLGELTELAYLNQVYEEKFGFRFVVFVDGRPKAEILTVLQQRLERSREEELETGLRELVAIARDRWRKG